MNQIVLSLSRHKLVGRLSYSHLDLHLHHHPHHHHHHHTVNTLQLQPPLHHFTTPVPPFNCLPHHQKSKVYSYHKTRAIKKTDKINLYIIKIITVGMVQSSIHPFRPIPSQPDNSRYRFPKHPNPSQVQNQSNNLNRSKEMERETRSDRKKERYHHQIYQFITHNSRNFSTKKGTRDGKKDTEKKENGNTPAYLEI